MSDSKFTLQLFYEFLDSLNNSGAVNPATARNIRNSSQRIMAFATDSEKDDVTKLDVDELVRRYQDSANPTPNKTTLSNYKSRTLSAIGRFKTHQLGQDITDSFSETTQEIKRTMNAKAKKPRGKQAVKVIEEVKTFELPIPLRGDLIVTITNLPRDLTKEEARRISNIIESFSMFDDITKE